MPVDPTDSILIDPTLTEEDREAMMSLGQVNRMKKTNTIFDKVRERENVEKLDFAIKAILQHLINSRKAGNGNT